jgi:chorismate mutase
MEAEEILERGSIVMEIADWRKKIDEMDEQMVELINKRAEAASAIGDIKRQAGLPVYEPQREKDVFEHVKRVNKGPLPDAEMIHVFERLIDVMRSLQRRDL